MADQTQNQSGMPNPNDDTANRQPQQFERSTGQSGGSFDSDTSLTDRVREHMTVVGPDGQTCGKVDSVDGGRIKLTRNDSADGQHHYLDASHIEGIEGDQIRLIRTPDWNTGDSGESSRAM
jgi:hypothetical protein